MRAPGVVLGSVFEDSISTGSGPFSSKTSGILYVIAAERALLMENAAISLAISPISE